MGSPVLTHGVASKDLASLGQGSLFYAFKTDLNGLNATVGVKIQRVDAYHPMVAALVGNRASVVNNIPLICMRNMQYRMVTGASGYQ